MKKRKRKPIALSLCECGGEMRPVTLKEFDFTPWSGLSSRLGQVPGIRCSKCNRETIPGLVINYTLREMSVAMLRMPHRLPAECARFLRRVLEVTQQELADRMGIARETVAQWERGEKEISPQHDFILRTLFTSKEVHEAARNKLELLELLVSVRSEPPPRDPDFYPMRFENIDYEKTKGLAKKAPSKSTSKTSVAAFGS